MPMSPARISIVLTALSLGGCVAQGPTFTPQELYAVQERARINNALAQDHKITWVEATKREIATATAVAGNRVDDSTRLMFAYKLALASEVDAGRMTPEVMDYRYAERLQQNKLALEAQDQQRRQAFAEGMAAFGQGLQNASQTYRPATPVSCTSNVMGTTTFTHCY